MFTNNNAMQRILRTWTDFHQPIDRRTYVTHGLALAAVKYLGDVALVYAATGRIWTPAQYVLGLPALWVRWTPIYAPLSSGYSLALILWMLPFLALGVTLTLRRAVDANRSPWLSAVFLLPFVNYVLIAILALTPSEAAATEEAVVVRPIRMATLSAAVRAGVVGVLLAIAAAMVTSLGVTSAAQYGMWLFLLTPFFTGASTAFIFNRSSEVSAPRTVAVVLGTVLTAGLFLLVLPIEGAICLLMMLPLIILLALLGALVGRGAAQRQSLRPPGAAFMLLAIPLTAAVEPPTGRALHEVQSAVVINASPDQVWPHVIAFREIPEPTDWLFRSGIAYPIRARIDGTGVGAIRYCEFSTGPFVEPITRWEPGRRLSFNVVASPAPMHELSPYPHLSPPHLHGYLRSQRGEFRLVDLGDGRTRVEGSTWYQIEMAPEAYWRIISDALIHRIHQRVLDHIKLEVEQGP